MSKKILVTGASGGFGILIVNSLLNDGHKVVASMRNTEGKNKEVADELRGAGALVVDIDVTSDESVDTGVAESIKLLEGLDVVINNAGVGVIGMQEHFTVEDFKKLFDINVFGVQRINRAALPHLRAQNSGLLVHVSSILGRMSLPFFGPYNASKWALEALAENYRVELSAFGIDSCIVEPGAYPTSFITNLVTPSDESRHESYGEFMNAQQGMMEGFEQSLQANEEQDPQKVADAVLELINMPAGARPVRTVVDSMGMGDPVVGYNDQLEQIMNGTYSAFGIEGMLSVKN